MRVRPDAVVTDGLTPEELNEVIRTLTGADAVKSETFGFQLGADPHDPVVFEPLRQGVQAALNSVDVILFDMRFDSTVLRGITICDALMTAVLFELENEVQENTKILVLVEQLPTAADGLHDVLQLEAYDSQLAFIDEKGRISGEVAGADVETVASLSKRDAGELLETIRLGTLRNRGVHTDTAPHIGHYLFQYEPLKHSHDAFTQIITDYLVAARIEVLVFDPGSASSWFESCLGHACIRAGVARLSARYLRSATADLGESANESVALAKSRLEADSTRVCYVVPAFDSGNTLSQLRNLVGRTASAHDRFLTLFLNEEKVTARRKSLAGLSSIPRDHAGEPYRLDYVLAVPIEKLASDDWRVEAAGLLGEVEEADIEPTQGYGASKQLVTPTRIALWSLIAEHGAGVETPIPKSRERLPIRYFPLLQTIGAWDAHWLAESIVARILSEMNAVREGVTIVLPAENSAISPISHALDQLCGVYVCKVQRDIIDADHPVLPTSIVEDLDRHSSDTIVVLDESAISHRTISVLSLLVEKAASRKPSLYFALFDLGGSEENRETPLITFLNWEPFGTAPVAATA